VISAEVALSHILPALGGTTGVAKLSEKCIIKLISHPGDKVVITDMDQTMRLPHCRGGYKVYDDQLQFRYSVAFDLSQPDLYETYGWDVRVPEFNFGYNTLDDMWVASVEPGDFFYVHYTYQSPATLKTYDRIILVVKSPVSDIELPANTARNVIKGF
jgi:hypothetical protein